MDKLVINMTPTGMVPTKAMTEHVPIAVSEIVDQVHAAYEVGITMLHLHARDEWGEPTYKAEIYGKLIEGIRRHTPDLVICVSLSGRNFKEFEKRAEPLTLTGDLKPDMGSLTLSSLNFARQASLNDPEMVVRLTQEMKDRGILPELEAFDLGMVNYIHYLIKKNLLIAPHYCNLFVGNVATAQLDLAHLGIMVRDLPNNCLWSVGGIGDTQLAANTISIAMGGGVRVGLEDNIYWDQKRTSLGTNVAFVKRIHDLAATFDRPVMSPSELRSRLGLKSGNGEYGRA